MSIPQLSLWCLLLEHQASFSFLQIQLPCATLQVRQSFCQSCFWKTQRRHDDRCNDQHGELSHFSFTINCQQTRSFPEGNNSFSAKRSYKWLKSSLAAWAETKLCARVRRLKRRCSETQARARPDLKPCQHQLKSQLRILWLWIYQWMRAHVEWQVDWLVYWKVEWGDWFRGQLSGWLSGYWVRVLLNASGAEWDCGCSVREMHSMEESNTT